MLVRWQRHSLMRIWNAAGLNVRWYVPAGDASVFNITCVLPHSLSLALSPSHSHTPRSLSQQAQIPRTLLPPSLSWVDLPNPPSLLAQNVLQGVADPDVLLHDDDKALFEAWTSHNFKRFWAGEDSPLRRLDIAVIDDPQRAYNTQLVGSPAEDDATDSGALLKRTVTALIPIIRRDSPRTKIVFRSHIQSASPFPVLLLLRIADGKRAVRADLIDKGEKQQKATWDYLWSFIKQADLFVSVRTCSASSVTSRR